MKTDTGSVRSRGRPPGPAVDPAVRREEILDAAERVIARTGPTVAFAEVAAEAGYARTAIYAAFPEHSALVGALATRHTSRLIALSDEILDQPIPLREIIQRLFDLICRFVEDNPRLHPLLMQGIHTPDPAGSHRPLFTQTADWATAVLDNLLDRLGADHRISRTWGCAIIGAVLLAAEDWNADRRISRAELVDSLTRFAWPAFESIGAAELSGPLP